MSDDASSLIEENDSFIRFILSNLSHKYVYIAGFLISATPLLIPNLDQPISFQIDLLRGRLIFLGLSSIVLVAGVINILYNIYRENVRLKHQLIENFKEKEHMVAEEEILPKVRRTCPPQILSPNPDAKAVLILDPSEKFHQDDLVGIWYISKDVETEIGYGQVLNIHEGNKLIQIEILYISKDDILKGLLNNDNEYLTKLEVRPHMSAKRLEEYKSKMEREDAARRNS